MLSLAVQESMVLPAQDWVKASLVELGVHPGEQQRIVDALTEQIEILLKSKDPEKTRTVTLHLFSAGDRKSPAQGWGFFIINQPVRAARGALEIFVYPDPPD
jgi:hypothetical protein